MTALDRSRLRELAEKATPGPWCTGVGYSLDGSVLYDVAYPDEDGCIVAERMVDVDAEFIAASRSAVPELLDENDRLRALLDDLSERLRAMGQGWLADKIRTALETK